MSKAKRISEDVLAEQWYSFLHQLIGRMQEAFRTARSEDSDLSQKAIAEKLGKPAPFISRCLSGQQNMTIRTIHAIARAMGYRLEINFRPIKSIQPSNFRAPDLRTVTPRSNRPIYPNPQPEPITAR
jgi:transcriptional regulator with XRE-family HTH domain